MLFYNKVAISVALKGCQPAGGARRKVNSCQSHYNNHLSEVDVALFYSISFLEVVQHVH